MKYFTPIQKISLGALSVIVIVLAIVAFTIAGSLSAGLLKHLILLDRDVIRLLALQCLKQHIER